MAVKSADLCITGHVYKEVTEEFIMVVFNLPDNLAKELGEVFSTEHPVLLPSLIWTLLPEQIGPVEDTLFFLDEFNNVSVSRTDWKKEDVNVLHENAKGGSRSRTDPKKRIDYHMVTVFGTDWSHWENFILYEKKLRRI